MQELVKVATNAQGEQVVNARDLHQFLIKDAKGGQTGRDFSHWIVETLGYGFVEGEDYEVLEFDYLGNPLVKNGESDNQQIRVHKRDYALTLDCAKQVAMIQNNDKGKQARQYFIECEKQLRQVSSTPAVTFHVPTTYAEALRAYADKVEETEKLASENAKLLPKAEYTEQVLLSSSSHTTTTIAAQLNMSAVALNKILCEKGVQYRHQDHYILFAKYKDKGYAKTETRVYQTPDGPKTKDWLLWTEKGRLFIQTLLNESLSFSKPAIAKRGGESHAG